MANLTPERAIAEIDDLLRTAPRWDELNLEHAVQWRGRFHAITDLLGQSTRAQLAAGKMATYYTSELGIADALALLHQCRYTKVLEMPAPMSLQVSAKAPFDYFDEVRKLISTAASDLLFVDPYLDASFIGRYMPHVPLGAKVRLLGSNSITALASAASMFTVQHSLAIEVRKVGSALHDRFVFIDAKSCYQSGASFKDGGVKAPATIVQIVDAFLAVQSTYEGLWASGAAVS